MVLEKTLESLLDCKETKPVPPKGNQSWVFIGRTGAEAETPVLWPPIAKSQLIRKDPDAGKDCEGGKTGETVANFIFLGSKITADGVCSHEIKRCLLIGRKVMTNLDSRDITLPTKVHLVKAMVFPVVMYGCESWTI